MFTTIFFSLNALADSKDYINFRYSPIASLLNATDFQVDLGIANNVSLGVQMTKIGRPPLSVPDIYGEEYKLALTYYSSKVFEDGWYASFLAGTTYIDVIYSNRSGIGKGTVVGIIAGYHWFWSRFNINLGVGRLGASFNKIDLKDSNGLIVETISTPTNISGLSLMLGFTF